MHDGVVAEQGGGDARGRCRVLVGGRAVRHQRRGDLVGREDVLVRARPVGQQRAMAACVCVSCALAVR